MEIKSIKVLDHQMAYREAGSGASVLFLHGNPTSSYLWRNVMPPVARIARCVAPDLIGMGRSDKLDPKGQGVYSFQTHRRYLDAFVDAVFTKSEPLTLVLHDWGSALGFDWARRHPDQVHGVVYMEAIVRPFTNWDEFGERAAGIFQGFRSEEGEKLILDRNMFIERILPGSVLRGLTDEEMIEYRRPFMKREDRWPTLEWPRSIPVSGVPADVAAIAADYAAWMSQSEVPKLFVNAEPGAILAGATRDFCRTWPNQKEIAVAGSHFIQEDSGAEIGEAITEWLAGLTV